MDKGKEIVPDVFRLHAIVGFIGKFNHELILKANRDQCCSIPGTPDNLIMQGAKQPTTELYMTSCAWVQSLVDSNIPYLLKNILKVAGGNSLSR